MVQAVARLCRWLFNSISVVLLVLCLAIVALRMRGGASGISCWALPGGKMYCLQSQSDRLVFGVAGPWPCGEHRWNSMLFPVESEPDWRPEDPPLHRHPLGVDTLSSEGLVAVDPDGRVPWTVGGGRSGASQPTIPVRFETVAVPSRLLLAMLSPLPVAWIGTMLVRFRTYRRKRFRDPNCRCCGYNLTGNTSGLCPECGTPVANPT